MSKRGSSGGQGSRRRRRSKWLNARRRLWLAALLPVAISAFARVPFVADCTHPFWGVVADLIGPAWTLAILPIAGRLRAAVAGYGRAVPGPAQRWVARLTGPAGARACARAAQVGAVLLLLASYTREWERFGEEPQAVWFALMILATFGLLLAPLWSIRLELHRRGIAYLDTAPLPQRVARFLLDEAPDRPRRAPHVLAFSLVTLAVSFTILGQLDSLLQGMHSPGEPAQGIDGLPAMYELDLSTKPATVIERVGNWREYTDEVGAEFGSAYLVVTTHAVVDTLATIPAYLAIGITLAALAWRRRLRFAPGTATRRAFELITLAGIVVLLGTVVLDVSKNFLTWHVMDRAWNDPASLPNLSVRLLWGSTLARTAGLYGLAAASLLLLALAEASSRRLRRALVAVRAEVLLLGVFACVVLLLPQTADVIRGWHMSHSLITVGLVVILSMLLRWTSARNLRLQQRHWEQAQQGRAPAPALVRLPGQGGTPELGRFLAGALIGLTVIQVVLSATGLPVGRGLAVPAGLLLAFAAFGLPLPPAPYRRGDRPVDADLRRNLPRLLGAAVYLIVGVAVLKAAAASMAYARHQDWWLACALVPPAIGLWRISTRTASVMGRLEAAFAALVLSLAATVIAAGDPELSPAALAFAGITFAYGALAFVNSYERTSLVSRLSQRWFGRAWAKPFAGAAGLALAATVIWFYADPIAVAPHLSTMGMIVIATIALTLLGAGAVRLAELSRPPRLLAAFGIRRMPVVTVLVVWLLLAPTLASRHVADIPLLEDVGTAAAAPGFEAVWERWAAANLAGLPNGETPGRKVVPLLLVSSSGGGLRAAAWTSFVLDCLFEGTPGATGPCEGAQADASGVRAVALMSGVSGGSLGIAAYLSHLADAFEGPAGGNSWVDEAFGDDYLAAPLGWLFFLDLPRSLIGFGSGLPNRSELMERAWQASWPEESTGLRRGVTALWEEGLPPVIFNGTSVNDGCRVNLSALDLDGHSPEIPSCAGLGDGRAEEGGSLGATYDLVDFLCPGDDIALSTAAGMASRFPVVATAGRLAGDIGGGCASARSGAVFVVDGGYLEGSGAGTLLDTWDAISDRVEQYNSAGSPVCVVPFMVHIDNGYETPAVSGNQTVPRELLVPVLALANSSSGITAARAEAALAFEAPFTVGGADITLVGRDGAVTSRYVRLVTRAHPGVQAPLGWTLSQASIDDLRDQLGIAENAAAFAEVRSWLDGGMLCLEG